MNRTIHYYEEILAKSLVYLVEAHDCYYQTQRMLSDLTEPHSDWSKQDKIAADKIHQCYTNVPNLIKECGDYILQAQMACTRSIECELNRK